MNDGGQIEFGQLHPEPVAVAAVEIERVADALVPAGERREVGNEPGILLRGGPDLDDILADFAFDEAPRLAGLEDLARFFAA